MGVLPLQFLPGQGAASLGLDGTETFAVAITDKVEPRQKIEVTATKADGTKVQFETLCRIDTPVEVDYYRNGGILQTVLLREQAKAHARRRLRSQQQLQRSALRLHDLDGRPLLLSEEELEGFQRRCLAELELPGPRSWAEIRRHWRRQSLIWHPDRGGDRLRWLRRQCAYEALQLLWEHQRAHARVSVPKASALFAEPSSRRWRWRWPQRR